MALEPLIELANALLFSLPGAPVIYYGDEIGMGDNIWLPDRNGVRTPMQWDDSLSAGFSKSAYPYAPVIDQPPYDYHTINVAAQRKDPGSLWHAMQHLIRLRKSHPVLADGELTWLETGTRYVLAYWRRNETESMVLVHNLSPQAQQVGLHLEDGRQDWTDLQSGRSFNSQVEETRSKEQAGTELRLELAPYQSLWLGR